MSPDLTPAELRALVAVAIHGGRSEAATALGCSPNTVRNHVHRATKKLKAVSALQAFYIAVERGLITVRRRDAA